MSCRCRAREAACSAGFWGLAAPAAARLGDERGPLARAVAGRRRRRAAAIRARRAVPALPAGGAGRFLLLNDARRGVAAARPTPAPALCSAIWAAAAAVRRDPAGRQLYLRLPRAAAGAGDQRAGHAAVLLGRAAAHRPGVRLGAAALGRDRRRRSALGAAVHIFVGHIEAPLLIRPYLLRHGARRAVRADELRHGRDRRHGDGALCRDPRPGHPRRARQHPGRGGDQHAGGAGDRGADGAVPPPTRRPPASSRSTTRRSARWTRSPRAPRDGIVFLLNITAMLVVLMALVSLVNMALGLLPDLARRADDLAAPLRLRLPPGDVADRHPRPRSRRRRS